jgi:hypothetical protein
MEPHPDSHKIGVWSLPNLGKTLMEAREKIFSSYTLQKTLSTLEIMRFSWLLPEVIFYYLDWLQGKSKFLSIHWTYLPIDDTKQRATPLGLQVQSVVARLNFPHEETRGLYWTLGEQTKMLSLFLSGNLQNNLLVLRPQIHKWLSSTRCWM